MRRWTFITCIVSAAIGVVTPTLAQSPRPRLPSINITADSARGWLPSQDQQNAAPKAALAFLGAKDQGHPAEAYALMAEAEKQLEPFAAFSDQVHKTNAQVGAVKERRIIQITWTKDPAHAPAPGIYAAIDIASRFANADRACGYLVLYQAPTGGDFKIMREEENVLNNATAAQIAAKGSQADVDKVWAQLSANCPNFDKTPEPTPLAEADANTIGYASVAAALQDLRSRKGVTINQQAGWTIAVDDVAHAVWSFSPPSDPSYPSAVKRQAVQSASGTDLMMSVLCESSKTACDNLVRQFETLNAQVGASGRKGG